MDDIYKNIEEYNSSKEHNILIAFDYMIADMISDKTQFKSNRIIYER